MPLTEPARRKWKKVEGDRFVAKALEGGEEVESLYGPSEAMVVANLRKAEPGEVQGTKGVV